MNQLRNLSSNNIHSSSFKSLSRYTNTQNLIKEQRNQALKSKTSSKSPVFNADL